MKIKYTGIKPLFFPFLEIYNGSKKIKSGDEFEITENETNILKMNNGGKPIFEEFK